MRASVIVVNLNGEPFIYDCLSALQKQSYSDFEVIIVDNGSKDNSCKAIRARFPEMRLIELKQNQGFASACSIGLREARGEEILVLNNDAIPDRDWLKAMIFALDKDEKIGMVASRVINKKTQKLESAGIYPARNGLVYLYQPEYPEQEQEVFGACGVAGLYRGRMIKELGFYPEDFFIYYEDADLAYRAKRAGWKAVYCPSAIVYHLGSETTERLGIKTYYLARNRLRSIIRNWELNLVIKNLLWIFAYELASFLGGVINAPLSALRARIDFFKALSLDLRLRKDNFKKTSLGFDLGKWLSKDYPGIIKLWKERR